MQAKTEKTKSLKNVKKDVGKPEKLKYKPLTGKVFYLDIPSNVISEKIGKDLKELGGVSSCTDLLWSKKHPGWLLFIIEF